MKMVAMTKKSALDQDMLDPFWESEADTLRIRSQAVRNGIVIHSKACQALCSQSGESGTRKGTVSMR